MASNPLFPKAPRTRAFQIAKDNDAATIKFQRGVVYFLDCDTLTRRLSLERKRELALQWMWLNNVHEYRYR